MNTLFRHLLVLASAGLMAACGGGGNEPLNGGGGGDPGTPVVADLLLQLSKANIANTGSDSVLVTVTALDASRRTVADAVVDVTADNDALVSVASATTGADGTLTATLTIGANRSNRTITITVASGGASKSTPVTVFGASLSGTLVPAVLAPSAAGSVQYRLIDQAGNPMIGESVQVVATGLTPAEATGTTGSNGDFTFAYTAASTVGAYEISATAGGSTDTQSVQVQTASTIPAVPPGTNITSASVSANPNVVGTNADGASGNRAEVRALFLTVGNVPVPNVRVRFDLEGDVNAIGGSFSTGTEILYANANGVATTAYIPASRSSPTDGVTVRACYAKTESALGTATARLCPNSAIAKLTVTSEPLGVSIGTNELIDLSNALLYKKQFIVTVVDSAGVAKPDVNLAASIDLKQYRKGFYAVAGSAWAKAGPLSQGDTAVCLNEDTNRNGVREAGEDRDNDGRLDPGKSDVSVRLLQSRTGVDGTAVLEIQYPRNYGSWVDALITVAASGVSGTEGRANFLLAPVPVPAAALTSVDASPAFASSPYGQAASCTNPN